MHLVTIKGWPELGVLVAWNLTQIQKSAFPSQCELILATHNGQASYKNSTLLERGFELSPQKYRNPNSGASRCSFFAGWRENVKIDDLILTAKNYPTYNEPVYQTLPYFCGIRIGPKNFYIDHKDFLNSCCGNIHILDPIEQKEDLEFFLKLGFEPVVHFKTGRVLLARFFSKYLVKD